MEMYNPEENEFHTVYNGDDNFVLMQSTGFTDKNGTEIYEGDILAMKDANDEMMTHDLNGDERFITECGFASVEFDYGMWYLHAHIGNSLCSVSENEGTIEIIGNIHQNPELLPTL